MASLIKTGRETGWSKKRWRS